MKKMTFIFATLLVTLLALNSCVEKCEGECDIDENGKLDCPCDDI